MSEMVERVAEAMRVAQEETCDRWPQYEEMARAAIAAMREPTQAMQRAWEGPEPWDQDALEVWQGLIDAALTGKPRWEKITR